MQTILEFKNVKKSFSGKEVLKGISFQIQKGDIVFILGTSGTGKSVLLKNLVGLMRPDQGEILYKDQDITNYTEEEYLEIRKNCCMVFQHPALFDSMSVYDNIAFGLQRLFKLQGKELEKRVEEAVLSVDLGLDVLKRRPSEISYGMQKRVGIARSLSLHPEILLFDEPTTGLDPVSTNAVNQLIQKLSKEFQTTSLVVSHDMACAIEIADYIVVLDKGNIVEAGSVAKIKSSDKPLVKAFLEEVLEHD